MTFWPQRSGLGPHQGRTGRANGAGTAYLLPLLPRSGRAFSRRQAVSTKDVLR